LDRNYELLLEISQQISQRIDLQDVVSHLLASLRSVVDYDAAGIFVLHRNVPFGPAIGANLIAAMATIGFDHIAEGSDPMLRSGKGIVGHVIRTGAAVVAPDVAADPHYIEGRAATRSEIAVPIVSNTEVIGALNLESNRPGAYSPEDAERLQAFAVAAAIAIEKALLHRQMVEKHLIEQQLRTAREVQASLLPSEPPDVPGYDIAGLNLPAWDIGGDYYDYLALADGRLGLVIADVSGKGVPAALLMATFRAALRVEARRTQPVASIIAAVHQTLAESMDTSRYVTAVYGVLDPADGTFTYVNCGHNPPVVQRAAGARELLPTGRRAIGMLGHQPARVSTVRLGPGDVLVLYTDGVVEIGDAASVEFGMDRLAQALSAAASRPASEIVDTLVSATRAHAGRGHYDDDFTLLVVKRQAPAR
jgi:sigma-B regulation protein RsbU (phosphoserine phosphatase)